MKKKFKFLAIVLVTLMFISALPLAAFAYETDAEGNVIEEPEESLDNEYGETTVPTNRETQTVKYYGYYDSEANEFVYKWGSNNEE